MSPNRRIGFLAWVALLGLIIVSGAAQAAIFKFALKDVTFADGGTASGVVEVPAVLFFDAGQPTMGFADATNWDIKVSGGNESDFPAFEYTPSNGGSDGMPGELGGPNFFTPINSPVRFFVPILSPEAFFATPGAVFPVFDATVPSFAFELNGDLRRRITSGEWVFLEIVPEPSGIAFLSMGLVLLLVPLVRKTERCPSRQKEVTMRLGVICAIVVSLVSLPVTCLAAGFEWVNGTVTSFTAQAPMYTVAVVNGKAVRFCDPTTGADYAVNADTLHYDMLKVAFLSNKKVQVGVQNFGNDSQSGAVKLCIERVILTH